ncbi:MAG: TIM-barrel domain-containing protein, partial [Planctomycetota bacterium]
LAVAREYKERGLPLSLIVIDFFHWPKMGDFKFDPELWPDPSAMVRELKGLGVEVMVSVWPTVNATCEHYSHMAAHGMLVRTEHGAPVQAGSTDNDGGKYVTFYDPMNPEARSFLWERIREGYVSHGITRFWLDTCEPELIPPGPETVRYHLGNGREVSGLYPRMHARCFYEGLKAEGDDAPLTLCRSAWCGSQRVGAAVWSADIPSTFDSLRRQVTAGLNIAMSGIPWWTTDIGGFYGGNIEDEKFHELLVRWFQYGVFCPIFRLHGVRRWSKKGESAPNEVWSYGEKVYEILREQLILRERLRPYVMEQMAAAERDGTPPMRPLFYDFPADERAWEVEDQFMFGPDILVAPVTSEGARARSVYLPAGAAWADAWTDGVSEGGRRLECEAPMSRIPVFVRKGSGVRLRG